MKKVLYILITAISIMAIFGVWDEKYSTDWYG